MLKKNKPERNLIAKFLKVSGVVVLVALIFVYFSPLFGSINKNCPSGFADRDFAILNSFSKKYGFKYEASYDAGSPFYAYIYFPKSFDCKKREEILKKVAEEISSGNGDVFEKEVGEENAKFKILLFNEVSKIRKFPETVRIHPVVCASICSPNFNFVSYGEEVRYKILSFGFTPRLCGCSRTSGFFFASDLSFGFSDKSQNAKSGYVVADFPPAEIITLKMFSLKPFAETKYHPGTSGIFTYEDFGELKKLNGSAP